MIDTKQKMPISDQKMKKLKVAMVVLLLGFTIYLCFRNYKHL